MYIREKIDNIEKCGWKLQKIVCFRQRSFNGSTWRRGKIENLESIVKPQFTYNPIELESVHTCKVLIGFRMIITKYQVSNALPPSKGFKTQMTDEYLKVHLPLCHSRCCGWRLKAGAFSCGWSPGESRRACTSNDGGQWTAFLIFNQNKNSLKIARYHLAWRKIIR